MTFDKIYTTNNTLTLRKEKSPSYKSKINSLNCFLTPQLLFIRIHQEELKTSKYIDAFAIYVDKVKCILNSLPNKKSMFNSSQ